MKLPPRAQFLLIAALFVAPIVASTLAYFYGGQKPTANHGELLLPPALASQQSFARASGKQFEFSELRGLWVLVATDSGACPASCIDKLTAMRQVRLALGRDAERVTRVLVADDAIAPDAAALAPFEGMQIVVAPPGGALAPGASDHDHVYLVDPNGNVMMRWRVQDNPRGMLKDLERLLKASQIG